MTLSLLESIATPQYLRKSWDKLNKSNKGSHGLSYETIEEFQNSLENQISEISKQLLSNNYKFNPVRAVLIPKKTSGEFRPLRVGDVRDRLVQKALSNKLEELLSKKYSLDNPCSYAYQKDRGIEQAISKCVEHFKKGNRIILEADIKKFFDNVNRTKLLNKVFNDLPDSSINSLIEDALTQSVGNLEDYSHEFHHYFIDSIDGIPQGNSLSPLLANIYLSDFDQRMIKERFSLVRYADDFIVLCQNNKEAKRALQVAKEELETKLGLQLHDLPEPPHLKGSKTRIVDPHIHEFSFLSIRFDGTKVWVNEKKVKDLMEKIKLVTDIDKYKGDKEFKGLITIIARLKNLLEGWLASYKFVDVDREFSEIDNYINYKLSQVFIKLQYKLKSTSLDSIKLKGKPIHVQAFKQRQRINSGVPYCHSFIESLKRNKIVV
ncbi:MAG: reverse transcriptase domain-containing protein [Sphingobacteriales bacterium]